MYGPSSKVAGVAGVAAGTLLLVELSLFLASGWSAEAFAASATAMAVIRGGSSQLLGAAFVGFVNLALTIMFIGGIANRLAVRRPSLAAAALWFALIGAAGHALVPLGLWHIIPRLMQPGAVMAPGAWEAFNAAMEAAHGVGSFFFGLAMLAAGIGLLREAPSTLIAGAAALCAGALTIMSLLLGGLSLPQVGGLLFLPALTATVLFRVAGGLTLLRKDPE